ncbi:MAG: GH92 family glycosyl hydrolase [Bacteroidales bacterium]|nr:GH92 family glycosyl hydrolase [Bacteroidales bacterium]
MPRFLLFLSIATAFFHSCQSYNTPAIIWQIGVEDSSPAEFALAPDKYADFLSHDFGWEDRFYLIGRSSPGKDWPYILPGPVDGWGGTSGTAGLRTHVLNILFGMERVPAKGDWKLIINILDAQDKTPPLFKVSVNGKSWKYAIPKGSGKVDGTHGAVLQRIEIPIGSGLIREGGNEINLTNLEGSWLVFDNICFEGPRSAQLETVNSSVFVRNVKAADYHMEQNGLIQPLLVDIEHLSGTPDLTVKLDGKAILGQPLEEGRYILEAPMPLVGKTTESKYAVLIDGKTISKGKVIRSPQQRTITPADYVNTFLGTAHSRWMIAPGPWMPFSMVKLSPDNQNNGWQAGYQPSFESIGTFSHIHEWTMTGLGMMPVTGPLKTKIGDQSSLIKQDDVYRSAIDKSTEEAPLGYYKVKLTDYDITAELTATTRCGFHRYTYPKGSDARVMMDLQIPTEYRYNILEAEMRQVNERRVEGFSKQQSKYVWSHDADQDYTVYFVIEFDHDIKKFGGWTNDQILENIHIKGKDLSFAGCYAEFDTGSDSIVQARSAISYVDLDGARKNLETEVTKPFGWSFEAVRRHQEDTWNDLLNRVQITSNDSREKMRFYTNLYRSFCRNAFSDVDGRWVDATEKIRQFTDPDAVALGCDAFWNTFWNLNQMWNLIAPEWSARWVKSQLAMYDANGWLAKGPAGMEYIPVMVGEHEIPLLVSAYQMGIRNYDAEKMFAAAKKMQTTLPASVGNGYAGNRDLGVYLKHHYVPADKGRFSNTLEYSYDDWTVSQLAKSLGKDADYKIFADRGTWWRNAIEPDSGYAHLRYADGSWDKNFDPFKSGANHHYVEGNAWQLTFFVPQDVPALAEAIGKQRFIDRLTWGFEASEPWRYNAPGDQYWDFPVVQGNQQSMHFAFLFNWVGQPWQTQRWTRSIIDRYYGFEIANAYLGDEDQGQMSAWFVMAALGLFQTDGGCSVEPVYEIASPLFEKAVINLGERFERGKTFTIEAKGASRTNKYVQSAKLNGTSLNTFKFPAKELLKGGSLILEMGPEPNKNWGVE